MQLSIVIPTYNRSDILRECLEALGKQNFVNGEFEVVVVDDGSTDNTRHVLSSFQKKSLFPLRFFHQKNSGQGAARNRGVQEACGKIIIFIGDDILVHPDFLHQHVEYHRRHFHEHEGVLGLTLWDPRVPKTPFTEFMTNGSLLFGRFGGHQFAYEKLSGKTEADYRFFYTSNISLKRSLFIQYLFDESFRSYGWEDIELGYRLSKDAGFRLYYNSHAVGYHYHPMEESSLEKRMWAIGRNAVLFHQKYPELRKIPSFLKTVILLFLSHSFFIRCIDFLRKRFKNRKWHFLYYYLVSKKGFLEGIQNDGKK